MKNQCTRPLFIKKLFLLVWMCGHFIAGAVTITSNGTGGGSWTLGTSWVGGVPPAAGNDVIIAAGDIVTMNGSGVSCLSLTINGSAKWISALTTNVGTGGITISATGNLTGTAGGILTCTGNLSVSNATVTNKNVTIKFQTTPAITISGTGTVGKLQVVAPVVATNTGTLTITSTLSGTGTFENTSTCNYGASTLTVTTFDVDGVGNTFVYNASGSQTLKAANYYNLTLSGGTRVFPAGTVGIAGTLTNSCSVNTSTNAGTVDFNGSGAQTIPVIGYYNLTLSNAGVKTFAAGSHGIKGTISTGGTATADATTNSTTINYNNTGAQTVKAMTYYNLTLSGSGTKTFASGTTTISNNMTMAGTATGDGSTNSTIVIYDKAGTQTVGAMNYYDLQLNTSGVKTFGAGTTGIANTLSLGGTASANFTTNSTTLAYNGGGAQSVLAQTYYNLSLSNAGVKTFASGTTYIKANFTIGGTASADLTTNSTTLDFYGSGAQNAAGANYYNLTFSDNGTKTLTGTATLTGVLNVTLGTFDLNGNSFTLLSTAASTASIGIRGASGYITGNVTVQRYIPGGGSGQGEGDRMFGSPVSGIDFSQLQDDFRIQGMTGSTYCTACYCNVNYYDEAAGDTTQPSDPGWTCISNTSNVMATGQGYDFYIFKAGLPAPGTFPITIEVTGPPHMGQSIAFPIGGASQGYNLVANPYPSAIDWESASGWVRNWINPVSWVYDRLVGDFRVWNHSTSSGTGSRYIASFEGFFIRTEDPTPSMTISEGAKAPTQNPTFYKAAENQSMNALSLKLGSVNFSNASVAMVQFLEGATNGYDAEMDASKLRSPDKRTPYLATSTPDGGGMYALNALPSLTKNTVVPLISQVKEDGSYFISIELNNLNPEVKVLLEDRKIGITTDLTRNSSYAFTATTAENNAPARFYLHFVVDPASSVIANDLSDRLSIYTSNSLLNIDFNVSEANNANVEVFNLMGQKVSEMNHLTVDKGQKAILDLSAQPAGVYLVNVNLNGEIISRKITLTK